VNANAPTVFEETTLKSNTYSAHVTAKLSDLVYIHFTKLELYYMLAHLSLKAI